MFRLIGLISGAGRLETLVVVHCFPVQAQGYVVVDVFEYADEVG
jgi:hypothetical protein